MAAGGEAQQHRLGQLPTQRIVRPKWAISRRADAAFRDSPPRQLEYRAAAVTEVRRWLNVAGWIPVCSLSNVADRGRAESAWCEEQRTSSCNNVLTLAKGASWPRCDVGKPSRQIPSKAERILLRGEGHGHQQQEQSAARPQASYQHRRVAEQQRRTRPCCARAGTAGCPAQSSHAAG